MKFAAYTPHTSMKKLGYSPLKLVTRKAAFIPSFTMVKVATESMSDSEAIKRTIEMLQKNNF